MNKILVIGSLNMDMAINAPRKPDMGETITGSGFMTSPGGKGANQAVAAARLGGNVSFLGCVGNDLFGMNLIKNLRDNNVHVDHIKVVENTPTGVAVITIVDGDNYIILDSGANAVIRPEHILEFEDLIKYADVLILQLEIPLETVIAAVEIAKRNGTKVLLNPAPACKLSDELLSKVDIFTPNESECGIITGIRINTADSASKAVRYLRSKGIGQVAITLGGNGVVFNRGDEIVHKGVPSVKVVDTTAAGDSFSGALAVALSNQKSIDEAIEFACLVGTITVTRKGAQNSLPKIDEIIQYRNLIGGNK